MNVSLPSVRAIRISTLLALLGFVTALPLAAQCAPSRGPFAGTPLAFSIAEDAGRGLSGGNVFDKSPGFQLNAPSRWVPQNGLPDFRFDVLFRTCGGGAGQLPDIDATSLGEDWVIADADGKINLPQNRWAALTFSVSGGSRGAVGSVVERERNAPNGAGGDLFSWLLPGSALPPVHVEVVERGLDRQELGFQDFGDVDAMDLFMGLHRGSVPIRTSMPNPVRWFFSVSQATIHLVPTGWWGGTPPSGASIFVATWNPRLRQWGCPEVFLNYDEIGLGVQEEVDALAIDLGNSLMLFSTKTRGRNQLLLHRIGRDGVDNPTTYTDAQGVPVTRRIEILEDDDIDAICAIDPSLRAGQGRARNVSYFATGVPQPKHFGFPGRADASAFRRLGPSGDEQFETFVTGWTQNGPRPGFALLTVAPANQPNLLVSFGSSNRDLSSVFCADPRGASVIIPGALAFSGGPVELRWFLIDAQFTEITEAWPVLVRL